MKPLAKIIPFGEDKPPFSVTCKEVKRKSRIGSDSKEVTKTYLPSVPLEEVKGSDQPKIILEREPVRET